MKKIFNLLLVLLASYNLFAENIIVKTTVTIEGHTSIGNHENIPVFVVKANETLKFGLSKGSNWHYCRVDGNSINGTALEAYKASNLSSEKLHLFHLQRSTTTISGNTTIYSGECYVIINTTSHYVCSHAIKTITIWHGDVSRWERSRDGGNTWTNIACTSYQYTESNPTAGTAMYRVLGTDGTYSDVVTITYVDAVPSTIQTLPGATNTKMVDDTIIFTVDVVDNGYTYQWKKDGTDIPNAVNYRHKVSAMKTRHAGVYTCVVSNGCNEITSSSAKLIVNKCPQVIDFPEIPVHTYSSGLTYTLPKTTNKGLTITYQSMNTSVATISGNILTIKAPGTAVISASQVGNDDYLEATPVSRTLTVNKRSQVITFGELPIKTYEDLPFTLPQKTDEGLTISYTSTNTAVATVSGNTVTILKPGTTDIIASQAGDATHYAAAEVSQTLIVNKAAQEITFGALSSKTYGDAPFELNKVSNKNLPITYTSSDAAIASIEENVVTIKHPGTVTITASQAGNAYYLAAEPVAQTLTINKANQSINFPALESRAFDSGDFELSKLTDKGLTILYESSNPEVATISNNIVHIVGAGNTEITASQEGDEYYNAAPTISQSLTITKATQIINFPELPTCIYDQEPIQLNATVNSGLPIEYESSDYSVAIVNGDQLTIVGAGQCYITASVAGNKNYYTATPVERTLFVNKSKPTLTFAPLESEYMYGDAPIALVASSNSGNVTFTSSNPAKLLIAGQNAIINGAGTFTITASVMEDANHLAASASQEITINKAPLMVTANNASREYGDSNHEFTYSIQGFVNGDTKAELTAVIEVSSVATITSPVGTYEIVAAATSDENYQITCKKGVLTIEKAALTISTQASREYGENNPEFVFSYTGFKNNENSSVLSAQPQAYSIAKKASPVGSYPIYISGAGATNYIISYEEGTLVVTKAPLTIKALDVTRKRLEANPVFELSISGYKLEETIADLDKLPTIQCEADINSPAGTYPIVLLNDGYATNYEYTLINGTLTIEKLQYTISVSSDDESKGTVTGGGVYDEEMEITITAIPQPHHHFLQWNDGNTSHSRTIRVTQNASYTAYFAIDRHIINVNVDNQEMGSVTGSGEYDYGTTVQISAIPNYGYHFVQWDNGNKTTPRTIIVTSDATYTATFAKNLYAIIKRVDATQGTISGPSVAEYLDNVTLTAVANYGYHFTQWSDGVKNNPRSFKITQDTVFSAEFEVDRSGQCGNNLALTWTYNPEKKTLEICGNGAFEQNTQCGVEARPSMTTLVIGSGVTAIETSGFSNCPNLTTVEWNARHCADCSACPFPSSVFSVIIGNGVEYIPAYLCRGLSKINAIIIPNTVSSIGKYAFADINNRDLTNLVLPSEIVSIGNYAFAGNTYLEQIDFGSKLEYIGTYAFNNCARVTAMTCLAEVTPDVGTGGISSISSNAELYVLSSALQKYKVDPNWSRFFVKELGASQTTPTDDVIVEPGDNTATFTWPTENNADSYTLQITKDGEVFCTLVFNSNGQLIGINFAPSRDGTPHSPAATMTANGMQFTITGLNMGTLYRFDIAVKDNSSRVIAAYTGSFTTKGLEDIDDVFDGVSRGTKIYHDGQILILRGDKTYTLTGQEVK